MVTFFHLWHYFLLVYGWQESSVIIFMAEDGVNGIADVVEGESSGHGETHEFLSRGLTGLPEL